MMGLRVRPYRVSIPQQLHIHTKAYLGFVNREPL